MTDLKESKDSKSLVGAFRSTSDLPATTYLQKPHQAALSPHITSRSVSPRPHSSDAETSARQAHGPSLRDLSPLAAGGKATARGNVTTVPSGEHGSASSPDVQGPSSAFVNVPISPPTIRVSYSVFEPIVGGNPAPPSTSAPHIPTSICQVQAPVKVGVHIGESQTSTPVQPDSDSSVVWTKALGVAKQKLSDNNLPLLNLTNLTSQSAEENIQAVITALNTLQEAGDQRKRWSYTWRTGEKRGEIRKGCG